MLMHDGPESLELIGEDFFFTLDSSGNYKPTSYTSRVTRDMFKDVGRGFVSNPPPGSQFRCPRFASFADLFYRAASQLFGLRMTPQQFMEGISSMNIESYVQRQEDWVKANSAYRLNPSKPFEYLAPVIMLEGMKFLEEHLLKNL